MCLNRFLYSWGYKEVFNKVYMIILELYKGWVLLMDIYCKKVLYEEILESLEDCLIFFYIDFLL